VIEKFIKKPFVFKLFIPLNVFFNSFAFFFSADVRTTAPTSLSDSPMNTLYTLHPMAYYAIDIVLLLGHDTTLSLDA